MRLAPIAALLVLVSLAGCSPEVSSSLEIPEVEQASGNLVSQLGGSWQVHTVHSGDCPLEWRHPFVSGVSSWTDEGDHLAIQPKTGAASPLQLWPVDSGTLERVLHVDVEACEVTETITLVVDNLATRFASGVYSSVLTHNGDACRDLAGDSGLPDQCETLVEWQARRLSP